MKLSNTNIAIILAATVASNVQAATPERTTEEAQNALRDYSVELKLSARNIDNLPSFYPAYSACLRLPKPQNSCEAEFNAFKANYKARKDSLRAVFDQQSKDLELLCRFDRDTKCTRVKGIANAVIQSELAELEAGSDSISEMDTLKRLGGFGKMGVDAKMSIFRDGAQTMKPLEFYKRLAPLLATQSAAEAAGGLSAYKEFLKRFRTLLFAIRMYRDPSDVTQDGLNVRDFVKPDFKSELAKINVPAGRFSVMPVDPSMSIEALRKENPNASAEDIKKILYDNYNKLNSVYNKTSVKPELDILVNAIKIIFAKVDGEDFSFELYKKRLAIFERAVEGIIRYLNVGESVDINNFNINVVNPLETATITKYVKMWMYAKQIVGENGSSEALFGTIDMPAPIEPVAKAVEPAEESRSRSSSTASTDSTSSTSSTKSFLSYFGF